MVFGCFRMVEPAVEKTWLVLEQNENNKILVYRLEGAAAVNIGN